jgi:hypothetical protein
VIRDGITVHMLVRNEDRFIWYALSSVLPYADKVLLYDTGSSDLTLKIIRTFQSPKLTVATRTVNSAEQISSIREEMLAKTQTRWVWIVDGDEIYPQSVCEEIRTFVTSRNKTLEGIVVRRYDLLGDIYHRQDEHVGAYELFGQCGHFVLRLLNRSLLPGLTVRGIYPLESNYDGDGRPVIFHSAAHFAFTQGRIWHAMYLTRSSKGAVLRDTFHRAKYKTEWGIPIRNKKVIPEIFFAQHPSFVPDVSTERTVLYSLASAFITPIKMLKRSFVRRFS